MGWYAISVFEGDEDKVQTRLQARFKESIITLVPKKRVSFRKKGTRILLLKLMFPGYVLIKTKMDKEKFEIINQMSGVIRLITTGKECAKINENEISIILKLINKDGIIEMSKILLDGPGVKGFTVLEGPLKGMEHIIQKLSPRQKTAQVLLMFRGNSKTISVGADIIFKENQERGVLHI